MKWYLETTVWNDARVLNGVYYLDDSKSKLYAYMSPIDSSIKVFKNPISFNTRGRKFVVNHTQPSVNIPDNAPSNLKGIKVSGSNGSQYIVSLDSDGNKNCSCTGFKFRGTCKHLVNLVA